MEQPLEPEAGANSGSSVNTGRSAHALLRVVAGRAQGFCSVCGSNVFTKFSERPEELGFALRILDDDPGYRPVCHVFVGSKAPWYEITDSLPQYEGFPTGHAPAGSEAGGA